LMSLCWRASRSRLPFARSIPIRSSSPRRCSAALTSARTTLPVSPLRSPPCSSLRTPHSLHQRMGRRLLPRNPRGTVMQPQPQPQPQPQSQQPQPPFISGSARDTLGLEASLRQGAGLLGPQTYRAERADASDRKVYISRSLWWPGMAPGRRVVEGLEPSKDAAAAPGPGTYTPRRPTSESGTSGARAAFAAHSVDRFGESVDRVAGAAPRAMTQAEWARLHQPGPGFYYPVLMTAGMAHPPGTLRRGWRTDPNAVLREHMRMAAAHAAEEHQREFGQGAGATAYLAPPALSTERAESSLGGELREWRRTWSAARRSHRAQRREGGEAGSEVRAATAHGSRRLRVAGDSKEETRSPVQSASSRAVARRKALRKRVEREGWC